MNPFRAFWLRVPEQVKRLSVMLVAIVGLLLVARSFVVPKDFGKYGYYRASAVEEIISQDIQYAGHQVCTDCHEEETDSKYGGYHKNVACETCHGPAAGHADDPESMELQAPRGRGYCTLCHEYLPSRPTGFPQIVSASHNPIKPCISCHDPHDPKPTEVPRDCAACHATIARTKSVSHHVYIPCTRCHEAREEHKISPREYLPSKPSSREFCGGCHARGADASRGIPRVDLADHGQGYVCWQCHYPHLPEAR
jgi:hypothetical protein